MARTAALTLVLALALLGSAAAANAATYHVDVSGTDTGDCTVSACATIEYAIEQHRVAPTTSDVISVGSGTFVGNVEATSTDDQGLTIQGTLGGGGSHDTTIRADGTGTNDCDSGACGVVLGISPTTAVKLQDVDVDTDGADDSVTPIDVAGGSDLVNVHARAHQDSLTPEIVNVGADDGTLIDSSTVDATGTSFAEGVFLKAGATLQDSHVLSDQGAAVDQCDCSGGLTLTRTWLEVSPSFAGTDLVGVADLTLDSSLITGGSEGAAFEGLNSGTWTIANTTIDVAQPGVYDSALPDVILFALDGQSIDLSVNSSLLAEEINEVGDGTNPGHGSITCTYTDFQTVVADSDVTVDCAHGSNGNTVTDPADQFVGGSPFSWALKTGAPAIDTGDPAALAPGQSTTDLAGDPRVQPGTVATCVDGVRDKGAYEHAAVSCIPQNTRLPSITNGTSPVAGTKLGSNPGRWAPPATSYTRQWTRCDATTVDDCTAIPGRMHNTYTPTNDDAGFVLRLQVVAHNSAGDSPPVLSAPTGVVAPSVPVVRTAPTIIGASPPTAGAKLSSSRGTWLPVPTSYARQWMRCDATNVDDCTAIAGKTASTYKPTPADVGFRLRLQVIATNSIGQSDPALSAPTQPVEAT